MKILNIKRNKKGQIIHLWDKHRIKVICICGKKFETIESRIKIGKGKYCSRNCFHNAGVSEKTRKLMSLLRKGKRVSIKTEFKKGQNLNHKNYKWKGDEVGYYGLHTWVNRTLRKAEACVSCGSTKNVQWANKTYKYIRDIKDWISLCRRCHMKYDKDNWGLATRLWNLN